MSAPTIDGRTWLERARELVKMTPYEIHERPVQVLDVLRAMLPLVEAAIGYVDTDGSAKKNELVAAAQRFCTVERKDYR